MKSRHDQPPPSPGQGPAVWPALIQEIRPTLVRYGVVGHDVLSDMRERDTVGRARYGTPLQPFNGRSALLDGYQELLDGAVYMFQDYLETGDVTSKERALHLCELAYTVRARIKSREENP